MTFNGTADGWDLIVSPWPLDEHMPAWAIPAGATALVRPSVPAGSQLHRTNLLYQSAGATVARAARPLLLSCDCPSAMGAVAGLQRRYDDMAVVSLDGHGDFNNRG